MANTPHRWFETEDIGAMTVARLSGAKTLDEQTSQAVGAELAKLAGAMAGRKLVLNLVDVTYLASGALAMLLTLHKKLHDVGGKLVLANIRPKLYEVFEVTKLDKLFEIAKSAEDIDPHGAGAR